MNANALKMLHKVYFTVHNPHRSHQRVKPPVHARKKTGKGGSSFKELGCALQFLFAFQLDEGGTE